MGRWNKVIHKIEMKRHIKRKIKKVLQHHDALIAEEVSRRLIRLGGTEKTLRPIPRRRLRIFYVAQKPQPAKPHKEL